MANKEKLLANAQKFISKGQISKAIGEYKTLVGAFPKDVRNRQKLAELLSRNRQNEDALAEYEAVAKHYTETGFYLKAIAVFKQMQRIDPSQVDIYHSLAELNEKQGLMGNALTEYRSLVSFYDKKKMPHEAIGVLEKMLALDPGNLNASAKIAECFMATGRKEEALETFQNVVQLLAAKDEHAKIIKLYEHFLEICPETGTTRLPLARALLRSGAADKAIQVLKILLKNSPENNDINRCLADAYVETQDYENARLTLKHMFKQQEGDLDLREYYVRICLEAGEAERARDRLEEWKDDFFEAKRFAVLKRFYDKLDGMLGGDELVSAALSTISAALGNKDTSDHDEATITGFAESAESANEDAPRIVIDGAEELVSAAEDIIEDLPAEKTAAIGIVLDLDLDLDMPDVEAEEAESPDATRDETESEEDVELEVELELDDLDELDLEFEDDLAFDDASAEADEVFAGQDSKEGFFSREFLLEADIEEEDSSSGFVLTDTDSTERVEVVVLSENLESLDDIEELDVLEEDESLEEIEEIDILEDVQTLDAKASSGVIDFASALKVEAELEEAEFYLQQGLFDDAERVVQTLMEYRPGLPEVLAKLDEITQGRYAAESGSKSATFVDLMADLPDDDLVAATDLLDSFDNIVQADEDLSQKLVSELDSSDTESHYNLGIAYKEMGLFDDAIAEFGKAGMDPARSIDCISLTGQCYLEAGDTNAALASFKSGLAHKNLSDEERMTLNFELGMLHQLRGDLLEALESFQSVAEKDSFFRDVSEHIKNLRKELGLDASDDDGGPKGNRDRVSYI